MESKKDKLFDFARFKTVTSSIKDFFFIFNLGKDFLIFIFFFRKKKELINYFKSIDFNLLLSSTRISLVISKFSSANNKLFLSKTILNFFSTI